MFDQFTQIITAASFIDGGRLGQATMTAVLIVAGCFVIDVIVKFIKNRFL